MYEGFVSYVAIGRISRCIMHLPRQYASTEHSGKLHLLQLPFVLTAIAQWGNAFTHTVGHFSSYNIQGYLSISSLRPPSHFQLRHHPVCETNLSCRHVRCREQIQYAKHRHGRC